MNDMDYVCMWNGEIEIYSVKDNRILKEGQSMDEHLFIGSVPKENFVGRIGDGRTMAEAFGGPYLNGNGSIANLYPSPFLMGFEEFITPIPLNHCLIFLNKKEYAHYTINEGGVFINEDAFCDEETDELLPLYADVSMPIVARRSLQESDDVVIDDNLSDLIYVTRHEGRVHRFHFEAGMWRTQQNPNGVKGIYVGSVPAESVEKHNLLGEPFYLPQIDGDGFIENLHISPRLFQKEYSNLIPLNHRLIILKFGQFELDREEGTVQLHLDLGARLESIAEFTDPIVARRMTQEKYDEFHM
tara:strand:- start:3124 stop:4023 length:900 start_codon:yes stop_codon:yes gene_type:complete